MISLTFYMEPVPQGRARTVVNVARGKPHAYTPDRTATAVALIKAEVISWVNKKGLKEFPIYEAGLPLYMTATFVRSRPKSLPKRVILPASRPDLDRYGNLVLDALTGIIYADDSQIVGMMLEKEFVQPGGMPRIEVSFWEALPGDQPVKQVGRL